MSDENSGWDDPYYDEETGTTSEDPTEDPTEEDLLPEYWTKRDGTKVKITEMTSTHLFNTIQFLRKRAVAIQDAAITQMIGFGSGLQGEMAQDAFDNAFDAALEQDPIDFLEENYPIYFALMEEARKRGLEV